jgi:maltose alpha-D-glucosyltransferase/alpha-amylase
MGDNLRLPERNCVRTPMQWSNEPSAGFTRSDKPVVPVISDGPYSFEHVNVAAQKRDPNSLMDWTERVIRMRKEIPEIGWGDFTVVATGKPGILALRYDWRNNSVLFVHNLTAIPTEVKFGVGAKFDGQLVNVLSDDHSIPDASGKHNMVLEPYGYRWFRIGGLDYLLKRTEI